MPSRTSDSHPSNPHDFHHVEDKLPRGEHESNRSGTHSSYTTPWGTIDPTNPVTGNYGLRSFVA